METIYKINGGGQKVRQNIQYNVSTTYEVVENSDWVEKTKANGQNFFTNTMWHTDLNTLQRWANEWAGKKVDLIELEKSNYAN